MLFIAVILGGCCVETERIYYLDSINGNDNNSGISAQEAWATLGKVNSVKLKPGDKVLFKAGSRFKGQLKPLGSGSEDKPVVISSYGNGSKPLIAAEGKYGAAVLLENMAFVEISDLEITNRGIQRAPKRYGVAIKAQNMGECKHVYLQDLFIHDVNGSLVKSEGGGSGIFWHNQGDSIPTRFIDLKIADCHILACGRNAITSWGNISRKNWYPSLGVVIRGNLIEQVPGDGIVPIGCHGALIEHNIMRDCPDLLSADEAAAGIWPWSCDSTVIQYNEVSGHNAKWDGQGFDSDWNCQNTIIQYNYSHDNAGGFVLVCNDGNNYKSDINIGTTNTIIRYNLSVNDGIRTYPTKQAGHFTPVFHVTGPVENTYIYNNVIYLPEKLEPQIDKRLVEMGNWGGKYPDNTLFANNIFYTNDPMNVALKESTNTSFTSNLYYGEYLPLPHDERAILTAPGWNMKRITNLSEFEPTDFRVGGDTPCKNTGVVMSTEEKLVDFFGIEVDPKSVDIGFNVVK